MPFGSPHKFLVVLALLITALAIALLHRQLGQAAARPAVEITPPEAVGVVALTDLQKATGLSVPVHLGANTISGLVMPRLGRVPRTSDELAEAAFQPGVLDVEAPRVGRVTMARLATPKNAASPADPATPLHPEH